MPLPDPFFDRERRTRLMFFGILLLLCVAGLIISVENDKFWLAMGCFAGCVVSVFVLTAGTDDVL